MEARQLLQPHRKRNGSIQTGQWSPDTEMNALPEGYMPVGRAGNIKTLRVRELFGITIRGRQPGKDHRGGGNSNLIDGNVRLCCADQTPDWRGIAQHLFNGIRHKLRVLT